MNEIMMLIVVLIPFIIGALIPLLSFKTRRAFLIFMEAAVTVNSLLV